MVGSISIAAAGMRLQEASVERSARRIALGGEPPAQASAGVAAPAGARGPDRLEGPGAFPEGLDIGMEVVGITMAQRAYEANARGMETSDEMLGAFLDIEV